MASSSFVDVCPSLARPFSPPWWLASGHLQTIYAAFADFSTVDVVHYDRTLLRTPDGGTLWVAERTTSMECRH
jgi:predicted alpha/beta-fold hydrolase